MDLLARDALIERLRDAFEDQGMYAPAPEIVEGVYEDAVEPLRQQLAGAVEESERLRSALREASEYLDTAGMQVAASDAHHAATQRGQ